MARVIVDGHRMAGAGLRRVVVETMGTRGVTQVGDAPIFEVLDVVACGESGPGRVRTASEQAGDESGSAESDDLQEAPGGAVWAGSGGRAGGSGGGCGGHLELQGREYGLFEQFPTVQNTGLYRHRLGER